MSASTGSSHIRDNGIFLVTLSGSRVASRPKTDPTRRDSTVQPYQYMVGPSPLLAGAHKNSTRFVAGWKVNSGRLNHSHRKYMTGTEIPNTTANVLNLADAASDDVAALARGEAVDVVGVVMVVFMIRTPGHY